MVKRYLARSAELTLARLEGVTAALNEGERFSGSDFFSDVEEDASVSEQAAKESYSRSLAEAGSRSQMLLATKLHLPRLPVQHVSRPRLLTLVERGVQGSLTLVSASAGSGKTTLLAEWAATTDVPVAWISLETADNDPARFLSYLMAALASLDGSGVAMRADKSAVGRDKSAPTRNGGGDNGLLKLAPTGRESTADPERALTGILNELSRLLRRKAVVILDDYHLVTTEAVHALLRFLLDHLPAHLHVIIGTRVDPPLPLARLRARGQLSEVRTEELRFLSDEVDALTSAMGLALSSEATSLLEQHTEGWIAGVQLLALALRGRADATAFLRGFRGTHRFLLDYVSEEVLVQQTPDMQHFLLRTSILTRMTGPLCDAVTDLPDGQTRLANLLRANLFVSALDDMQTWYRYHLLFAETLRAHLQKMEPELIPELYLRASRWYEQHQGMEEACDYALLAEDFPRAANLVAGLLPQMVEQGRFEQLGRWLGQLPPALIAASPQLYIATPWMYTSSQRLPVHMEQALKRMEQHVEKQQQETSGSWVEAQSVLTLFQGLTAMSQSNLPQALALLRKALQALTKRETALSQLISRFIHISLSVMYGASGDLATAEQILLDLSLMQPTEPFSLIHLAAPFLLGELYKAQGQLHKGEAVYESLGRTFESRSDIPAMPLLIMGFSLMRKASLLYEWNRLPEAANCIQQVLEIIPRAVQETIPYRSRPALFAFGLWAQARIEYAQGRPEAARYFLELVRNQPETMGEIPAGKERHTVSVSMLAAHLALACGQVEEAIYWKNSCGIRFDDVPGTLLEGRQVFAYLTLARVLIAQGRNQPTGAELSQALVLLEHWRKLALRLDFQGWLIEIEMLTALALQAQGNTRQALTTLGAVLAQAETEGYVRLFADEGQPMLRLLAQISSYTTASSSYIQRILSAIPSAQQALPSPTKAEVPEMLLDPLSGREREVLALLAAGASNQQIADRLVISLNTAKRHVKNILGKLDVTNRTQAVARARELQLL
jgi:LuxR family maltose regulon positive regulatory protein